MRDDGEARSGCLEAQEAAVKRVHEEKQSGGTGASASVHTVVQGDTLWGISRKYGLSLERLLELNPGIKNPNLIRMGEKVRVG